MHKAEPRRSGYGGSRFLRHVVRLFCVAVVLLLFALLYLYFAGVPKPILRQIVRTLNADGIHVDVASLSWTRYGWKAEKVCYFSGLPDDLDPLFLAEEVYIREASSLRRQLAGGRGYAVDARNIRLNPSTAWCVGLPDSSPLRTIERMNLKVAFNSEQVIVEDSSMIWCGVQVAVDGEMHLTPEALGKDFILPDWLPLSVDSSWYGDLEKTLFGLAERQSGRIAINFRFDGNHPENDRFVIEASADDLLIKSVVFDHAGLNVSWANGEFKLDQARFDYQGRSFAGEGVFRPESGDTQLHLSNSVVSADLLDLFPSGVSDFLHQQGLDLKELPSFDLQFGPGALPDLLGQVDGHFGVEMLRFRNLKVASLQADVKRQKGRLDIQNIEAVLDDRPELSLETGSCMVGGSASGSFFWDAEKHDIGCEAVGSFDPTLLMGVLSDVPVATNIINRFRFDRVPPQAGLAFGFHYDAWGDFFFRLEGSGADLRYHDVPLTALSASLEYRDKKLVFESLDARQGDDFCRGTMTLDFDAHQVLFDADAVMNPASIERAVYPKGELFSQTIHFSAPAQMRGAGAVDWRNMNATDFKGHITADQVELPFAVLDSFDASVQGTGPVITLDDMQFELCSGKADGMFLVLLDPAQEEKKCKVDINIKKADFCGFLHRLYPACGSDASGELSGHLTADADLNVGFLETAQGEGRVKVRHGQLADLPLFKGFSSAVRVLFPSFQTFSITSLSGDFKLDGGAVLSDNAYFEGDLISAKGRGRYSFNSGFNAYVQAQVLRDNSVSRIFRFLTDPLLKLFELRLTGPLDDPKWELGAFASDKTSEGQ